MSNVGQGDGTKASCDGAEKTELRREEEIEVPLPTIGADMRNAPCYFPQPGDDVPSKGHLEPMSPIGPWATGKVDWSPLGGITGTRPVVDRYSITRYSVNEWRANNYKTYKQIATAFDNANKNQYECKTNMTRTCALVNNAQNDSTDKVRQKAQLIGKWKSNLETAINAMIEEISIMEEERVRLKRSLVILGVTEAIAKECIDRRCGRPETELVRDNAEEEIVKELALIHEIRTLLKKTLTDFEQQQTENRTARQRMEYDWSDKKEAYEVDTVNLSLNIHSQTLMFYPGATRKPPEQSSDHYWEYFTRETLEQCENCRKKSVKLRATLDSILLNSARDLRNQADTVERALISRINCTQENLQRYENELINCLQKLADTENRIEQTRQNIRCFDAAMKVAQTRLNSRNGRPHVENCRDFAQIALINEVETNQGGVTAMLATLANAEGTKNELMQTRGKLEREIMLKRRTLLLDRERCMLLRSHFPTANALSGHTKI